jgi:hypothetical protein
VPLLDIILSHIVKLLITTMFLLHAQSNANENMVSIKEYTRQAFLENVAERRHVMEENVRFLQKRIL